MKPERSKWWFVGEMVLMILLGAAIFLIPRFHDASNERMEPVALGTEAVVSPARSADIPLEYIDHAVIEISSWDTDRIAPLLADATDTEVSGFELDSVASTLGNSLGDLETYSYPQQVDFNTDAERTADVNANAYLIDANYESGTADIVLHIVEEDGEKALWKLNLTVDGGEQDL